MSNLEALEEIADQFCGIDLSPSSMRLRKAKEHFERGQASANRGAPTWKRSLRQHRGWVGRKARESEKGSR
jgi:hypothetical protein